MAKAPKPNDTLKSAVDRIETLVSSLMDRMVRAPYPSDSSESLSYAQYRVLAHLCTHPGVQVGELGQVVGVARSTATEMGARLERAGLVTKSKESPRARAVRLEPTAAARRLVRQRRGHHREAFEAVLQRLQPEEGRELLEALETLSRLLGKAMP